MIRRVGDVYDVDKVTSSIYKAVRINRFDIGLS